MYTTHVTSTMQLVIYLKESNQQQFKMFTQDHVILLFFFLSPIAPYHCFFA